MQIGFQSTTAPYALDVLLEPSGALNVQVCRFTTDGRARKYSGEVACGADHAVRLAVAILKLAAPHLLAPQKGG